MFSDTPALPRRTRLGLAAAIVLIHLALGLMLARAFGGVGALVESVGRATGLVAIALPPAPPPPEARAVQNHVAEGASGAAGARASADQVIAQPHIVLPALTAPPVAGTGSETRSGAGDSGAGTGGGAAGGGTGSGGAGNGVGARYATTKPVKIAGDLAESDYAKEGRAKRLGTSVIVVLTVGPDGHVTACRVHQPSGDPDADAVTCRLAQERFRFKPAVDQDGNPVEASYGWQQRFFWK